MSNRLLSGQSAQIPLAAISFVAAFALVVATIVIPTQVDPPIGVAIAVLLLCNGAARLQLWHNRSRLPQRSDTQQ